MARFSLEGVVGRGFQAVVKRVARLSSERSTGDREWGARRCVAAEEECGGEGTPGKGSEAGMGERRTEGEAGDREREREREEE